MSQNLTVGVLNTQLMNRSFQVCKTMSGIGIKGGGSLVMDMALLRHNSVMMP